jgi:Flp pilus assembly pilin Flp
MAEPEAANMAEALATPESEYGLAAFPPSWKPIRRNGDMSSPRAAERGQGLVEYGLILIIVAVVCVLSLLFFGDQLSSLLSLIASAV